LELGHSGNGTKNKFWEKSPDWLFALTLLAYWALYPRRQKIMLILIKTETGSLLTLVCKVKLKESFL